LEDNIYIQHSGKTIKTMVEHELYLKSSNDDFLHILKLATHLTDCKAAAISFIEDDRQFIRYVFGPHLQPVELLIKDSLCQFYNKNCGFVEISHLQTDQRTPQFYNNVSFPFKYYGGLPIYNIKNEIIGSICVFDDEAKQLSENKILAFNSLVEQLKKVLELRKRNIQSELNESREEEFQTLVNSSSDLICILNDKLEIITVNESSLIILGYTPQDCIGINISNFIHAQDKRNILEIATNSLINKIKSFEVETRLISKDKSIKWMSWNAVTKDRKWFIIGRDITKTKEVLKNLNQLSTVASEINNGVVISDANSKVVWVNNAFTAITGYIIEDLTNQKLGDVIIGQDSNVDIVENARKATEEK
jgi:PAS domain S-box-containing protein